MVEEYLKKIGEELERLNNNMEKSIEFAEKARESMTQTIEAKKMDIWDEMKMWVDNVYKDLLAGEARKFSKRLSEADKLSEEEQNNFIHRIASIIKFKRLMDKCLSEEGILKLDEELQNKKKVNLGPNEFNSTVYDPSQSEVIKWK